MRALRDRIREASRQSGTQQTVIEKDYALSYVLAGIAAQPELAQSLVFKGGTALKKLFFGDYRFSEDLDFSTIEAPKRDDLEQAIHRAMDHAARLLDVHGPFALRMERYVLRDPHPGGQEAFIVRVQFPWHRDPHCRIKLEITHEEPVMMAPDSRSLIHGYD